MKPVLGIVLEYGFHEVKKYIHSGLAKSLTERFRIVWIALDKNNDLFDSYFRVVGEKVVYVSNNDLVRPKVRLERINSSVRRNWMICRNLGGFHNYVLLPNNSLKAKILGCEFAKYLLENLTLNRINKYHNQELQRLLKASDVKKIIVTNYSSLFVRNLAATAKNMDLDLYLLINSWKDLYTNNYIPFKNFNKIFVWDVKMKTDYLFHMPYLLAESIIVSGNPSFDYLNQSSPSFDREYYCRKYKVSKDSKWIYYTMMPPGIFNDEFLTVLFIADSFYKKYGLDYIFLVRRNPNHKSNEFDDFEVPENVRITEHYCSFDESLDMLIQSKEGEREWLDLLHHTYVNFSVPSTVTMEYIALGKRVFNISFNSKNNQELSLKQFFESGFYRDMFNEQSVVRIDSIQQLMVEIDLSFDHLDITKAIKASDIILKELVN
jgi:hypothetical protein